MWQERERERDGSLAFYALAAAAGGPALKRSFKVNKSVHVSTKYLMSYSTGCVIAGEERDIHRSETGAAATMRALQGTSLVVFSAAIYIIQQ